jgi:HEAT repeat protein
MYFRLPNIDTFSFLVGIILASLFWWIISLLRPALLHIRESSQIKRAEKEKRVKSQSTSAVEEHFRRDLLRQAQGLHLAAPLFSLDEIIEPPSVLAPPPRVEPGKPIPNEDIVAATLPYLPAWPELAAIYHAPTMTLSQALSGDSDIVLTGQPGSGKTVALAYLASRLARKDPEPGLSPDILPFLIHVADLDLPVKKDDPLKSIIEHVAETAPLLDLSRIPDFVRRMFEDSRVLLLLDGTDELTQDGLKNVVEFIKVIKRTYPGTRMVTTASNDYLDGLVSLNFIPFALSAWTDKQRAGFINRWGTLWTQYVSVETWAQISQQVEPELINGWLNSETNNLTPLEWTLKTWGAYAGDIRGSRPVDFIETHLRRLVPSNVPRDAMEVLALQVNLSTEPIFDPHKAHEWLKTFEPPDLVNAPNSTPENNGRKSSKKELTQAPSIGLISKMVESGLLTQHRNNRTCFLHPVFGGYLAGKALINHKPETLPDQPSWIGKFLALTFLAALGDASPLVEKILSKNDRPLSRNLTTAARWLRDAPRQAVWRGKVLAKLADLIRQTGQPLGLRGQALSAFINSNDVSVASLFRQLLEGQDSELLQLAALGAGAFHDTKSIQLLSGLINTPNPNLRRAGCLALVAIGTSPAMDVVASALLHGDENLRRAAAEALANHPLEGRSMLKEGATMKDDLLVRRSVIYGLGRIAEPWAEELINRMQTDDDQWAVRTAALEVTETRQRPNPSIPQRLPPPAESPWIIAFAGKQGLGVSPDKPSTDLLLLALKSGTDEERLAALSYLRMMPGENVLNGLYQAMSGGDPILREASYQVVAEMASRGIEIPDPSQFGVDVKYGISSN